MVTRETKITLSDERTEYQAVFNSRMKFGSLVIPSSSGGDPHTILFFPDKEMAEGVRDLLNELIRLMEDS